MTHVGITAIFCSHSQPMHVHVSVWTMDMHIATGLGWGPSTLFIFSDPIFLRRRFSAYFSLYECRLYEWIGGPDAGLVNQYVLGGNFGCSVLCVDKYRPAAVRSCDAVERATAVAGIER